MCVVSVSAQSLGVDETHWAVHQLRQCLFNALAALSACLVVVTVFSRPALAADLDFRAAWGGVATLSRFTELTIGVRSSEAGTFTVLLPGEQAETSILVDLPENQRVEFTVPYPVSKPGYVDWIVKKNDDVVSAGQAQVFKLVARTAWDIDLAGTSQHAGTVNVLSSTLPTRIQAYDSIRSIALTPSDLLNLTPDQLRALEEYMLRCGRVIILESKPSLLARLKQVAGCAGRQVYTTHGRFLATEMPSAKDVRAILGGTDYGGSLSRLTALLVVYASLLVAAGLMERVRTILLLGITASLALSAVSRTNEAYVTWLSWSQADAAESSQVRRTVLIVEGRGRSELSVPLPRSSVPQLPLPKGTTLQYLVTLSHSSTATLTLPTGFLTRDVLSFIESGLTDKQLQGHVSLPALALADRIAQKTKLILDLSASSEAVSQPAEGVHVQWHATVTDNRGVSN